jgi:signal peptidase II
MTRKEPIHGFWYLLLFSGVMTADRITKNWALEHCIEPYRINEYLSFELIFNRGVSWGLFNYPSDWIFTAVTLFIMAIIIGLSLYTFVRWNNTYAVIGEMLVLAGAISNIIDRFLYQGVVDFILLSAQGYYWPYFNVADACIVLGVSIMVTALIWEP